MSSLADIESYDFLFKLVLIDDTCIGKTNIISKYITNTFKTDSKSTVWVKFGSKILEINWKKIEAQIWTKLVKNVINLTSAYFTIAKGVFVLYDITKKNNFQSVDK